MPKGRPMKSFGNCQAPGCTYKIRRKGFRYCPKCISRITREIGKEYKQ